MAMGLESITEFFNVFMISFVTMGRFFAVTYPLLYVKFAGSRSETSRRRKIIRVRHLLHITVYVPILQGPIVQLPIILLQ